MSWNTWGLVKLSNTALEYESAPARYMWCNTDLQVIPSPTACATIYPAPAGWKRMQSGTRGATIRVGSGEHAMSIRARGRRRFGGGARPNDVTIMRRNGEWFASVTLRVSADTATLLAQRRQPVLAGRQMIAVEHTQTPAGQAGCIWRCRNHRLQTLGAPLYQCVQDRGLGAVEFIVQRCQRDRQVLGRGCRGVQRRTESSETPASSRPPPSRTAAPSDIAAAGARQTPRQPTAT